MLNDKEIHELANRQKVHYSKIVEAQKYLREHPFDHLQPSDPRFQRVWGEKIKLQESRRRKDKENAEGEAREKTLFQNRKKGMDKVHRKYTVI